MTKLLQKLAEIRFGGLTMHGEYQDLTVSSWTGEIICVEKVFRPIHRPSQIWTAAGEVFENVGAFENARCDAHDRAWKTQREIAAVKEEISRQEDELAAQRRTIAAYCTDTPTLLPEIKKVAGGMREVNGKKFRPVKQAEQLLKAAWGKKS